MRYCIVAGGKAKRFNSVYKELLPVNNEGFAAIDLHIKRAIDLLAREIVIVTTYEKIATHAEHIARRWGNVPIQFIIQRRDELLGALQDGMSMYMPTWYALADTVWNVDIDILQYGIELLQTQRNYSIIGLFKIRDAAGLSILTPDGFQKLPMDFPKSDEVYQAWGSFGLNQNLYHFLQISTSFDEFLFQQLKQNSRQMEITDYYDLGNWSRYLHYLKENNVH